ncbi:hypothetical protein RRG08_029735 [Elysia crispata]|uniref:Uncharacterized protein n=1 Tax=Elysia crispata TaxID=231223 RepID=A0AAE0ZHJ5_9GAST|nr:hypothetical protein RRG08_029735 [Elysia crispata]
MQSRARASYSALSELLPDVESFQNEVCDSKLLLKCFEDKNMSQLRSLQSQLELLHSQAIKMKSDVAVMRSTVSMMMMISLIQHMLQEPLLVQKDSSPFSHHRLSLLVNCLSMEQMFF